MTKQPKKQSAVSAVERMFQVPELVFAIMEYLRRGRIDLVALSLVSKSMRNMALKALVRDLDLPLSNWSKVAYMLKRNAGLVAAVQHVRLWDDEAHSNDRWRGSHKPTEPWRRSSQPSPAQSAHPLDTVPSTKWHGSETLLGSIFSKRRKDMPTLDLSFGSANVGSLKLALAKSGGALAAVVSVRVIVSEPVTPRTGEAQGGTWTNLTGTAQWDAIRGLVRNITDAQQSRASSLALKLFYIEDCSEERTGRHFLQDFSWAGLVAAFRPTVEYLRLHLSEDDIAGSTGLLDTSHGGPLTTTWPRLRQVSLILPKYPQAPDPRFRDAIVNFLCNNPSLETVELNGDKDDDNSRLLEHTFPNLQSLSVTTVSPDLIGPFLARHAHLRELRVRYIRDDEERLSIHSPLPALHTLRGHEVLVVAVRGPGSSPSRIEFDDRRDEDALTLLEWLESDWPERKAITCLSVEWTHQIAILEQAITRCGYLLASERLPLLCELILINTEYMENDYPAFPHRSAHYLKLLLATSLIVSDCLRT
ncbi:hypothetical protein V8E36_009860 [Tilletia maclaganii]